MTPEWYSNWCAEAFEQLTAKNARLEKDFHLGHWPRYDYDLTAGKLLFSQEGKVAVVAEIQIAGSTSTMAGNWLWGLGELQPARRTPCGRKAGPILRGTERHRRAGAGLRGRYRRRPRSTRMGTQRGYGTDLRRCWSVPLSPRQRWRSLPGYQEPELGQLTNATTANHVRIDATRPASSTRGPLLTITSY